MARKSDFTLPPIPVDAIFSTQAERDDALLERVHNIPLEELHPFKEVIVTNAGCTISSHCGPNCLGVLFLKK